MIVNEIGNGRWDNNFFNSFNSAAQKTFAIEGKHARKTTSVQTYTI